MSLSRSHEIHPHTRSSHIHDMEITYEKRVQHMFDNLIAHNPNITPILEQLNDIGQLRHGANVATTAEHAFVQLSVLFENIHGGQYASHIFREGAKRSWTLLFHDIGKLAVTPDISTSLLYMSPETHGLIQPNGHGNDRVTLSPYLLARQRLHTTAGARMVEYLYRYNLLNPYDTHALMVDAETHHNRLDFQGTGRAGSYPDSRYHAHTKEDYVIEMIEKLSDEAVAMREADRSYRQEPLGWNTVISHMEHFLHDSMIRKALKVLGFTVDRIDHETVTWFRGAIVKAVAGAIEQAEPLYGNLQMDNFDEHPNISGRVYLQHLVTHVWQEHHRELKKLEHRMFDAMEAYAD